MPKLPTIESLLFLCNILRKKWITKLIFCMQISMNIYYKLILWFWWGFWYLFPTKKFWYNIQRVVKLRPVRYFNQGILDYKQLLASEADYIFYALSVTQLLKLSSQINIALKKFSSDYVTAGALSSSFTESVRSF